ncbi:HEPN domain-containing protein [Streptomyces coriariae]|uniref:HEPN domain-containing protein n=1 Tax=Streptomyces coriariae TaxID=2864460 RepID=UPI001E2E1284|nr:HEPN domain-containing protein [Streptomyces coriariae]
MPAAHPQTREFRAFLTNLEYARKMIVAGQSLAAFQSPVIDIGDFYRAAWVQAVSAIDHWFHEELYRRVAELAAEDSPEMPYQLTKFELPLVKVEEVRRGTTTLADAVSGHVKAKWGNAALQNPRKISEALKLVTEEDIWAKAAVQLNEWNHGRTSMNAQTLKQKYNSITDRRNRIAHDADLLDGDLKHRRPISDADVTDAIDWIERIALAIATVLG